MAVAEVTMEGIGETDGRWVWGVESGVSAGARRNGAAAGRRGPVTRCRIGRRSLVDARLAEHVPAVISAAQSELDPAPDGGFAIGGGERFEQ